MLRRTAEFRHWRRDVRELKWRKRGTHPVSDHMDVRTAGPSTIVLGVKPRNARPGAYPRPNPTADPAGAGKDFPCSETPRVLTRDRQSRRGPTRSLLAGGFTTAVVAGSIFATAGTSSAASGWDSVGLCESGGNPSTTTGNGYYGLYQFDRQTWQSLGYSGTANQYSAAV